MENPQYTDNPKQPRRVQRRDRSSRFNLFKTVQTVAGAAFIMATLFTLWTPANLFSGEVLETLLLSAENAEEVLIEPTPEEQPSAAVNGTYRIGIVAGHWDEDDGHVCNDGFREVWLNIRLATLVQQRLADTGIKIDLLKEKDELLTQYKGIALIAIHNDTCDFIDAEATGFKVAPIMRESYPEEVDLLLNCMIENYGAVTGLKYRPNETTAHMTEYHNFFEVNSSTPIIIIEAGYLNLDREILTENSELIADGIASGIKCYLENRDKGN